MYADTRFLTVSGNAHCNEDLEYIQKQAYWADGAQVLAPHDKGIIDEVNKVQIDDVKFEPNWDLIQVIGGEMDYDYMTAVKEAMIDQEVILRQKDLNIVYSAMHGTGRVIVPLCLRSWGFQNINVVPEQMIVDGDFPTVVSPNPENAEAMTLGMNLGTKLNADLVVATDPDADRLAIVCRNPEGEWQIINGNQTAMMFVYYIIKNKIAHGALGRRCSRSCVLWTRAEPWHRPCRCIRRWCAGQPYR